METVSPEFIAILSVGVTLLSAGLVLARSLFATLHQFRSDMDKRIDATNGRIEQEFDKVDKRIDAMNGRIEQEFDKVNKRFDQVEQRISRQDDSLADIRERLGWIEGALGKHREPAVKTAAAG